MINVDGIGHDQIYAQLLDEVEHGKPYFFSKEDEEEMQEHNLPYYIKTDLERTVASYFRTPEGGERERRNDRRHHSEKVENDAHQGCSDIALNPFSKTLTRLFGKPEHTQYGNLYLVKEIR